jgi:hypothetical protein
MQLTQLLYVSSYAEEYEFDWGQFTETLVLATDELDVKGMTLFANGYIMQLLEGDYPVVTDVFEKLRYDAKLIGIIELINTPLKTHCLLETSIGYSANEFAPTSKLADNIVLFNLHPAEVEKRILQSPGKMMMLQFVSEYG